MGDRIVVLNEGVIQQVDTPSNIYNKPINKFVAGFIGQTNFFDAEIINNTIVIEGVSIKLPDNIINKLENRKKVTIGIRAEKMISGTNEVIATTDIVEMCGGERNIYVNINNEKCVAKVPLEYKYDDKITLHISVEDMYFFDIEQGQNILIE